MSYAIYLWTNAVVYIAFALWCTMAPTRTAHAAGYLALDNSGISEYLTVYGGLQAGVALFFGMLAMDPRYHILGLRFALLLYVPIVLFRLVSVTMNWPISGTTMTVAAMELVLLGWAVALAIGARERVVPALT